MDTSPMADREDQFMEIIEYWEKCES